MNTSRRLPAPGHAPRLTGRRGRHHRLRPPAAGAWLLLCLATLPGACSTGPRPRDAAGDADPCALEMSACMARCNPTSSQDTGDPLCSSQCDATYRTCMHDGHADERHRSDHP